VPALRPYDPASGSSPFVDSEDASRLIDRLADEGPPEQASRLHSCMKVKFDTLGRLLASRGVDMKMAGTTILPVSSATNCMPLATSTTVTVRASMAQPARYVYCDSRVTLGLGQYSGRLAEPMLQTTASATKMHDLFLAASTEIVANFATATECRYQGQQAQLFDNQNRCDPVGVACLIGYVPNADTLSLCNEMVQTAEATPARAAAGTIPATPAADALTTGKRVAVAALLAAAHMCE
jgi:hypothetical protein